jgi:hypothetical protein
MKIETVRRMLRTRASGRVLSVAREIGVTRGFISHVLAGRKQPGPKVLDYLGLECYELYRRKPETAPKAP